MKASELAKADNKSKKIEEEMCEKPSKFTMTLKVEIQLLRFDQPSLKPACASQIN